MAILYGKAKIPIQQVCMYLWFNYRKRPNKCPGVYYKHCRGGRWAIIRTIFSLQCSQMIISAVICFMELEHVK